MEPKVTVDLLNLDIVRLRGMGKWKGNWLWDLVDIIIHYAVPVPSTVPVSYPYRYMNVFLESRKKVVERSFASIW